MYESGDSLHFIPVDEQYMFPSIPIRFECVIYFILVIIII